MVDRRFFTNHGPFSVSALAEATGATLPDGADAARMISEVAPLDRAGVSDISFFDNSKYIEQFHKSSAGACFVRAKFAAEAPAGMITLITEEPYRCYALVAQKFYPAARPVAGIHSTAAIDPTAKIGDGATIEAGAVIHANVVIGSRSSVGANSVIHAGVTIGDDSHIGALTSISHTLIGDRVLIHRGVHIGQDGFGFALGRDGHIKVPQLGRVVIENDVEIGSGTTIDRGTGPDTLIGEGTKIDNLVQIGHNVHIGRRAVIVAQCGISGSTRIGDGAVLAGQAGLAGHIKIGAGAKIAAKSGVMGDIPNGASYGGYPAVPVNDWHRQTIAIHRLIKPKRGANE
ncbi:MAG: UDP-3-O-(3-hydroxymyristoyl)glucosamine N-acyltransferase [Rhodospirillales bacterium 12-54-5]|nr:MAG: UDP-3-O-(3-hydroxymyristoyl)glucosamine N-acyltransferase [Rhodospirillales bacterium 12-54-5]